MKKIIILFSIFVTSVKVVYAQYMYGTTGLLQMPIAEMQRDKTLMFGGVRSVLKLYLLRSGGEIITLLIIILM